MDDPPLERGARQFARGHRSLRQRLAAILLRVLGWRVVYQAPPGPKAVVIFYPHTSNWDFVFGMLCRAAVDFPVRWAAKHTLFRWPIGVLLRRLGGVAVDRRVSMGRVAQLRREFDRSRQFYLAITPEGTRSHTDCWKSGFYHLTLQADVPLGLAFIDYRRREVGVGAYVKLSGNVKDDLALLRNFYAGKCGKRPANQGGIQFSSLAQQALRFGGARERVLESRSRPDGSALSSTSPRRPRRR